MGNVIDIEECRCKCHNNSIAKRFIHSNGELCCYPCNYCHKSRIIAFRYEAHTNICGGLKNLIYDLNQGKSTDDNIEEN